MANRVEGKEAIKDDEYFARVQVATQDYHCESCREMIPDETRYVRVLWDPVYRPNGMLARRQTGGIDVYHVACWNKETGEGEPTFDVHL